MHIHVLHMHALSMHYACRTFNYAETNVNIKEGGDGKLYCTVDQNGRPIVSQRSLSYTWKSRGMVIPGESGKVFDPAGHREIFTCDQAYTCLVELTRGKWCIQAESDAKVLQKKSK